ncbi:MULTISPECIES: DUF3180 domain-containing protein [unclassified Diaminobutyricimonas]|uniref:DUF3180 domain-containing protein n=1 Tax=unclassified Diaminobutyricimonas TaxID=2643261 RepID=UPI0012F4EBC9|nr:MULTISPECIES: DUF3180 domain-containing protein [unclassified Diaminobutyricimonas]
MRPSTAGPLILLAVIGTVGGWFLDAGLAASGRPVVIPPLTLPLALMLIGVIVVVIAWPVRTAVRTRELNRVDPFYATRAVVLAKASSLSGALLAGFGLGITVYLLSRTVVPGVSSILMAVATVVGAAILLAAGLIAERMCTLPPDDDSPEQGPAASRL